MSNCSVQTAPIQALLDARSESMQTEAGHYDSPVLVERYNRSQLSMHDNQRNSDRFTTCRELLINEGSVLGDQHGDAVKVGLSGIK